MTNIGPSTVLPAIGGSTAAAADPWHLYYSPLISEFIASLTYTLFSNLLGIFGVADSASKLSIALLDGGLNFVLICIFGGINGGHFNPAITFATLLTFNMRLLIGFCMIFVQFFGAFFGSLLSRSVLPSTVFVDSFIALGILKRNIDVGLQHQFSRIEKQDYFSSFAGGDAAFSNRFQIFLLETLMSTLVVSTYMLGSTFETVLTTASSVGACRAVVSLIGLYTTGQGANFARLLANNIITSIFVVDDKAWRLFYLSVFASFASSIISAGIWWLVTATSADSNERQTAKRNFANK
uniref:Aquaporin n=1 Tax=Ditylenchus dipsaci TaxID=166011 RepID=A0A915DT38_9BILA